MNINPVAFNLFGKIDIRWYGILIAMGLVIGIVLAYCKISSA